ncbi:MAG: DUF2294 family protein [Tissierellia bacterium]|nr:DUF2294 family protein [Tissierellia bacterium]
MGNSCEVLDKSVKKSIEDSFKSFMAECFNKGPSLAKAYISGNCITIYGKNFLTPLEKNLKNDTYGECLIQVSRKRILNDKKVDFLRIVDDKIGSKVINFYIDFNVLDDSLCCVFITE